MRRLFALLVLLFAAIHPVVHQHPPAIAGVAAIGDVSSSADCPCTHAVAVDDAPPHLVTFIPPVTEQPSVPATPFVASAIAGELPARAPPAVA